MTTYTVRATRSQGWWTLQCVEVPGAISQVRDIADAEAMIREAIEFVLGEQVPTANDTSIVIDKHFEPTTSDDGLQ
ncbi:type II toxin-antitoxin system HicB family antitoxin [Nakamurella aerolata]|uniref:DUF1902 domain-containing protein n=1 Tax=Nakamurella aerolata TaxID=1656892 RepID=A0A849A5K6_9ACTN|nr:hypothetical protein [Nakamurella aerolata]NNG34926.1 hypothetical protein [Nakamurella aerolata]